MEKFVRLESPAVPLLLDDIDTDVITPMRRILEGNESMIEHAFEVLRFRADGSPNPDCVLNDARYAGAQILLAGRNFGCGSSRETAVWAVAGLGYRCILAPSYGDIFLSNCFKNGLLAIEVAAKEIADMGEEARRADGNFVVDLESCEVATPSGRRLAFSVSPFRREMLLHGLDDLGFTLRRLDAITAFENADQRRRGWASVVRQTRQSS